MGQALELVLEGLEKVASREHPEYLRTAYNLATTLSEDEDDHTEARPHFFCVAASPHACPKHTPMRATLGRPSSAVVARH